MFEKIQYNGTLEQQYNLVTKQLKALIEDEPNRTANLANASSLLDQFLSDVNWVGFYEYMDGELVLGPFQGLPACVRIPLEKGVCGTAAAKLETVRVADVEQFPGHIACDAASASEIVVPLIQDGQLLGVLDIDSPKQDRFSEEDEKHLETFAAVLAEHL
ncbi:GAF domain-containing protein [Salsuginibacillus halophilus]|uniref:GAF domain-containing protein n=1 Tax=Salsuginibacillus halophilus TaxID=517424 RepID=A0A2P8HBX2_9BACI|nr:GAF domain-containing protein [Salsuginibacillus halophilus]PSL43621.1 GAF domain-containing protein [Salsuginibacillus halophilus]